MAQHDYDLANQSGAAFRGDANNVLAAIVSQNSGASAPSTTFAYMWWADTTSGLLKQRNAANSGWLVRDTLAETFVLSRSSNTILGVGDRGRTIRATSSFTQTLDAVATLGDGWWCEYINEGTGVITFDPNASETISGQTTLAFGPGESGIILCNGSNFQIVCRSRYAGAISSGRNIASVNNGVTPNTKLDISADEVQLKDANGNVKVATSVAVTIDFGSVGANGIDTGSQAASTWYYGWVIAKEDGTIAGLGSTSSTAPTMPSGYTYKAMVTAARSNGSTQFLKYRQKGNKVYYESQQAALTSGTASSETAVSCTSLVPPNAEAFTIDVSRAEVTSDGGGDFRFTLTIRVISGSDYSIGARITGRNGVTAVAPNRGACLELPNVSQQFYYHFNVTFGTSQQADIYVLGFKLPLGGE